MLNGKRIVLGVTGGIAAYKACEVVSRLTKRCAEVRVVMTQNAREFVAPLTFETLSGNQVYLGSFERAWEIGHIALAKWADAFLIAPATANIIGKIANGIADDLLSTEAMANPAPMFLAPAMNVNMWKSPANQENIETLLARGVKMIGPDAGHLACGDDDIGRMSEPEAIVAALTEFFDRARDFDGKTVLVTAGPTREMIDPVRFLSNRSSGKMGYAIAEAARDRGAKVILISGPVCLDKPMGVEVISITSTLELHDAVTERAKGADAVIQAAAPADFRSETVSCVKLKKANGELPIRFVPNPDIAEALGRDKRPGQVLVAFAAETNDVIENAKSKLRRKNADLLVANDILQENAGFGVDTNVVTLIDKENEIQLPVMSKRAVADKILDRVVELLS